MQAGGPEVLEFGEIETPKPGHGEVLVNVEAAGANFIDMYRLSRCFGGRVRQGRCRNAAAKPDDAVPGDELA